MRDAAQAGFDAAEDNRGVLALFGAPDGIGIDQRGAVGTTFVEPAGGVVVTAALLAEGGVVGDHRVDAAA